MSHGAFITGLEGCSLSRQEHDFLRDALPWGIILFSRNIETPEQVKCLIADVRACLGWHIPVLIDQEGGRVQRLKPPIWPQYPCGALYGKIFRKNAQAGLRAAWLGARLIAHDLLELGIDVNCLPVADIPQLDADPIIGDRAYGTTVDQVTQIARAVSDGLLEGGVLPVLKHIPGHGRANADSHIALPIVQTDEQTLKAVDFLPFHLLHDLPMAMTAHVIYSSIDPESPATTSTKIIEEVIRQHIGFDGLLMSDDLSMQALSGSMAERTKAALKAGCDIVLHCNGKLQEMQDVAAHCGMMTERASRRAEKALALRVTPHPLDAPAAREEFEHLISA